jgi:type IX secretion system PorP/SprF family membrane protein
MKKGFILGTIILLFMIQPLFSQESGVVSFSLPTQNSLKFNKYTINPTFSFVKEDQSIISLYNKIQWVGVDNAPLTYFLTYSGKFSEQNSFAIGAFKQDYGILSTTGGILNYAHNVTFTDDSNLTFGLNLGIYQSGPNKSKIITKFLDPKIEDLVSNTLLSISPGINYGIGLFDLGLSYKNAVLYNFKNSQNVNPNSEKSIEGHIMYTGFLSSNGFLDESKFSGLVRVEKKTDKTVFSGIFSFEAPSLGWLQAGYNNLNGVSAGLGANITKNISVGYNLEKTLGDFSGLGISHEIYLAYVFDKNDFYSSGGTNSGGVTYTPTKEVKEPAKETVVREKSAAELELEKNIQIAEQKKQENIAKNKQLLADEEANKILKAKQLAELRAANKAKSIADAQAAADAKKLADAKALSDAKARVAANKNNTTTNTAENAKLAASEKARLDAERIQREKDAIEKAKLDAQNKLKNDAENKAKNEAARLQKIKDDLVNARLAALEKAKNDKLDTSKADAAEKARLDKEAKQNAEAERLQKLKDATDKAKADAAEKLRIAKENKANANAIKEEADRIAKEKADAAKLLTDASTKEKAEAAKAKSEADKAAKAEADRIAKEKADAAKLLTDASAKEKAEAAKLKAEADKAAKAEADRIAKEKSDAAKLITDASAKEKAEAAKANSEADKAAKAEADRIAKEKSDAAKLIADASAKEKAEAAKAKAEADKAAKAEADRIAKEKADAAKLIADASAKEKAEAAKAKVEADKASKAEADRIAKEKADAAKLIADASAKEKAEAAKAKAEADKVAKAETDKLKAEAALKAKNEAEKAKAEAAEKLRIDAENKAKIEADRLQKIKDGADKVKNAAAEKLRIDAENKSKIEADRLQKIKDAADKAKADAEAARLAKEAQEKEQASKSKEDKALDQMKSIVDDASKSNKELLDKLTKTVNEKEAELQELKDLNNDPSKAATQKPKEFVSSSVQVKALNDLKNELSESSKTQTVLINNLEEQFATLPNKTDKLISEFNKKIQNLKAEALKSDQFRIDLIAKLDKIKVESDIEKKRRIKRAESLNLQGQYSIDREALRKIRENTQPTTVALKVTDLDFGDIGKNEVQIIKKVENIDSGYYLILAVHDDVVKRDAFLAKLVASGKRNVDFFFNKSTGKYMIYLEKYFELNDAKRALETKDDKPYNSKMTMVKVEN